MVPRYGHFNFINFKLGPFGPWCEHLGSKKIILDQWDCMILSFFGLRPQCKPMQCTLTFGSMSNKLGSANHPFNFFTFGLKIRLKLVD